MTPAKPFSIDPLGINAYLVDGRPLISMTEICKYSRDNKSTRPFTGWLERTSPEVLPPSGSQGFPQAQRTAQKVTVARPQGGTSEAELIAPEVAALFMASELVNPKVGDDVKRRAAQFMVITAGAGLAGLANEACGLTANVTEAANDIAKLIETGPKRYAQIGNKVKALMYEFSGLDVTDRFVFPEKRINKATGLPKDDGYYLGPGAKKVLVELMSILGEDAVNALRQTQQASPAKNYKYKPSLEECMTDKAKARYSEIYSYFELMVRARHHRIPFTPLDWKEILQLLKEHFADRL